MPIPISRCNIIFYNLGESGHSEWKLMSRYIKYTFLYLLGYRHFREKTQSLLDLEIDLVDKL